MPFVDPDEEFSGRVMAPWLQSGWSPISPEALTLGLGLRRNRPNPKWLRCWARRARTPHEILVRNNERCIYETLTRGVSVWNGGRGASVQCFSLLCLYLPSTPSSISG